MITKVEFGSDAELHKVAEDANNIPDGVLVVDLGGGMARLPRADYVVDLIDFQKSRTMPLRCSGVDRCQSDHWIVWDICSPMPFFTEKQFGYSFCSQTVEDVRDPIAIIREMDRISTSGFVSTIDWTYELNAQIGRQWGSPTNEFVGYHHHRWCICVNNGVIEFVYKPPYVQWGFDAITMPRTQMVHISWEGGVQAREVLYEGVPKRAEFIKFLEERWGNQ